MTTTSIVPPVPTASGTRGTHNFRDLGGIPLPGGRKTPGAAVYRSCALQAADADALGGLLPCAPALVIDLRSEAEIAAAPGPLAAFPDRIHVPVFEGLAPVTAVLSQDPGLTLSNRYIMALTAAPKAFVRVLTAMAGVECGAVVFHCTAGKDRTGLVAALLLDLLGAAPGDIARNYSDTTRHAPGLLDRLRAQALARGAPPTIVDRLLAARDDDMLSVLAHLRRAHGGAEGYLLAGGMKAADVERLRDRLAVAATA
ncbi:Tyrosine-protein phosphatase precursor [Marinibacterium anthonyi]|nr:Tyrosine-protein phosphatase precursor [Marinibacterium anthonyi]